jgi:hypothetical protein
MKLKLAPSPVARVLLVLLGPSIAVFAALIVVASRTQFTGPGTSDEIAPTIPPVAVLGSTYVYYLDVRCGIRYAAFSGHWWEADTPRPAPMSGYAEERGTMTLISAGHASFRSDDGDTVDFHPIPNAPVPCS